MIRINLLPAEIQGISERQLNPSYVVGGIAGVLLVICAIASTAQVSRRKHLKEEITGTQAELDQYKPVVAQVEMLEQAKAQLQHCVGDFSILVETGCEPNRIGKISAEHIDSQSCITGRRGIQDRMGQPQDIDGGPMRRLHRESAQQFYSPVH